MFIMTDSTLFLLVLIAIYNNGKYFQKAIDSVNSLMFVEKLSL